MLHGGHALLLEHPRDDREYAARPAAEGHGWRQGPRPRQTRDDEPWRERQGPDWREDDRGRRGEGDVEARWDDHRADEREHGARARDGGRDQGVSRRVHDARQDEPRENRPAEGLRRARGRYADRRAAGPSGLLLPRR